MRNLVSFYLTLDSGLQLITDQVWLFNVKPEVCILYFCFIDETNVSNAQVVLWKAGRQLTALEPSLE